MTVIINQRLAPASAGAVTPTGTAFVASAVGGDTTKTYLIRSLQDFETLYSTRSGGAVPCWDWLDAAFREGLKQAYIGSYTGAGNYAAGLALFDAKYGPGQVVVVGEPASAQLNIDVANHANSFGRFAPADVASGSSLTAMNTLGDTLPIGPPGERIELVGPWLNYPPPAGVTGGTERLIPASAALCGIMARVDADGNPNRAPAGRDYALQACDGVSLDTSSSDRAASLVHKVNMVALIDGLIQFDSAQTAIPQDPSTPFWQANCARTRMWMQWYSRLIGRAYEKKNIDAEGHVAGALKTDLKAMLMDLYDRDALFGLTPSDAFDVNVGFSVNTTATAANATLAAVVQAKLSLYAKDVDIDLVTVPISGQVVNS